MEIEALKEQRKFFLRLALPLLGAGAVVLRHHWGVYAYWASFWVLFIASALAFPAGFRPVRLGMRKIGKWIGFAVTLLLLGVVYFLVLVPLGFVARIFGKEFMPLKPDRRQASYWTRRDESEGGKRDYARQY